MGIDNPVHLIFIAAVALIVLGPKRLPDLARSLGKGMREFRESMSEAVKDGRSSDRAARPDQAQLVAAPEPVPASPCGRGDRRSGGPGASSDRRQPGCLRARAQPRRSSPPAPPPVS